MLQPEGAKLIGGVWLPATEQHFVKMMLHNPKAHLEIAGKATYQYRKLKRSLELLPAARRNVCIDVGAHVGLWSMWLVKHFIRVEAFEPIALHASIFPHNVLGNYQLHQLALGAGPGRVAIEVPPAVTGNAHVVGEGDIEMRSLDSYGFRGVDMIKIDVEGYELQVVTGARETLLANKPLLVLEQKGNDAKLFGRPRDEALDYVKALGMRTLEVMSGDHILYW